MGRSRTGSRPREGARRVSIAEQPLPASWLLALDFDTPPQPVDENDDLRDRSLPEGSWNAFAQTRFDQDDAQDSSFGDFCGEEATSTGALSTRLGYLAARFTASPANRSRSGGRPRGPLHPRTVDRIQAWLRRDPDRWPGDIRRGPRLLIASRVDPNQGCYEHSNRVAREGWSQSLVRDYALFRPRIKVERKFRIPHPLSWTENELSWTENERPASAARRLIAAAAPSRRRAQTATVEEQLTPAIRYADHTMARH